MSRSKLVSLLEFKAWADRELLDLLARLLPVEAEALHTSVRTLNHVHVVDRLFRARLNGEPAPFTDTNTLATPALEALRSDILATDAWLVSHAQALSEDELAAPIRFTFTDGDAGEMTREEVLLHLVTHGGYHRGNVGQVLKGIGVQPPRDLLTRYLALARSAVPSAS